VSAERSKQLIAFAAIYLIWGCTYLAIRYAIETLPPLFMMGCRHLLAGGVLYGWARMRGAPQPDRAHWMTAVLLGALLFLGGHGTLAWAQQRIPSGVAALIVTTLPIWMTLLEALRRRGGVLTGRVMLGLGLGFSGIILLAQPTELVSGAPVDAIGAGVLLVGTLAWSVGSVYSKGMRLPGSTLLAAGMSLLAGGALLFVASYLTGERVAPGSISLLSGLSLAFLILFGSIIAYAAYLYLLKVTSATRVATYAFVNPIIAVFLGWSLGHEPLSPRVLAATVMMVAGVAAIVIGAPASGAAADKRLDGERRQLKSCPSKV
jgi:drug/metabolite transporter (DMT)-like permease